MRNLLIQLYALQLLCQTGDSIPPPEHHSLRKGSPMTESIRKWSPVFGMGLVLLLAMAGPLLGQSPLDTDAIRDNTQDVVSGIVEIIRYIVAISAVVMAMFEGFKASRGGGGKGWINVLMLLIVAAFALSPSTWVAMLGIDTSGLRNWGL